MSNYLFIPISENQLDKFIINSSRSTIDFISSFKILTGDRLVIATYRESADKRIILPVLARVTAVDRVSSILTLEIERIYNQSFLFEELPIKVQLSAENNYYEFNKLSEAELRAILEKLGTPKLNEPDLIKYIKDFIEAKGYYFSEETIYNYHTCLKTRPFVILAGLSGTGKSKLSQYYAAALGSTVQNGRYLRLAVRPNWNDDSYLLGHLNTISGEYFSEQALDFICTAASDPSNLYFFCLDEMNLAHVEYYFSQFLSALEEDELENRRLHLYSPNSCKINNGVPSFVNLPPQSTIYWYYQC